MGRNSYSYSSADDTAHLAAQIKATVGATPATWGLTADQMSVLNGTAAALVNSNAAVVSTRALAKGATQDRAYQDRACKAAIASIAQSVYANKSLTDQQIADLGLVPHKTTRTKVVPVTPTGLAARTDANGDLTLTWKRNGNAPGVTFQIEELAGNGDWAIAKTTTACRITLSGYAPGTPVGFRIVATKNGIEATPTGMVSVYATVVVAPTLRLAA